MPPAWTSASASASRPRRRRSEGCRGEVSRVRKWKKQFPKSAKKSETSFALYEPQIMAEAGGRSKFEERAERQRGPQAHGSPRVLHLQPSAAQYDKMVEKRRTLWAEKNAKARAEERKKNAPSARSRSARRLARRRSRSTSSGLFEVIARMQAEVKRLVKEGMSVEEAGERPADVL